MNAATSSRRAAADASGGKARVAAEPPSPDREALGRRLRGARKKFGWTLAEVAERSGVSITTISRAERGQLALSYEKFSALARALKLDIGTLFAQGREPGELQGPVVTRAGEGVQYRGPAFTYEFLATQASGKLMNPIIGTVHARRIGGPEDFARHEGEEWIHVLSGSLEVHFEDGRVVRLARGDSLYFDSRIGHAYISTGRRMARTIGATTSESALMRLARESGEAGGKRKKMRQGDGGSRPAFPRRGR